MKRSMPTNLNTSLGDIFKELNVPVHYSVNNDLDIITTLASHDHAVLLSSENHFLYYSDSNYILFSDFEIVNDELNLIPNFKRFILSR